MGEESMRSVMTFRQRRPKANLTSVPVPLHILNLTALVLLGLILVPATITRLYQFVILLPILMALLLYWTFRTNRSIIALYFGFSLSLIVYITICENIVSIDNLLGTQMTKQLNLGLRLQAYVNKNLETVDRNYFEQCCHDPLTWIHKPGSVFHASYDCPACGAPYEAVVDETGHLNQQRGLWEASEHIDLFLAGDSVTEGTGMPGVLELIRAHIPLTMWNLSIAGYGARQKINALLTYALPKQPRWLIVEFFAGNDVQEAIKDELCEETKDFKCWFRPPEMQHKLQAHSIYGPMVDLRLSDFETFDYYSANNFTLAITRYIINMLKHDINGRLLRKTSQEPPTSQTKLKNWPNYVTHLSYPAKITHEIRQGRFGDWVMAGMAVTYTQYERLVTKLASMEPKPTVILFYNPTAYEVYRDRLVDRQPEYDEVSTIQVEGNRAFAAKHGWIFLDLTVPLRKKLEEHTMWLYGRHDGMHWSHDGTAFVADVLAAELLRVMENKIAGRRSLQ